MWGEKTEPRIIVTVQSHADVRGGKHGMAAAGLHSYGPGDSDKQGGASVILSGGERP